MSNTHPAHLARDASDASSDPEDFKATARSLRSLATETTDRDFRARLLTLAADYDRQDAALTDRMIQHLEQHGYLVQKTNEEPVKARTSGILWPAREPRMV